MSSVRVSPIRKWNPVHCAVLGAGCRIRAESLIPLHSREAIGISFIIVNPPPILIHGNLSIFGLAARLSAISIWKRKMILLFLRADVLSNSQEN
jgi:hypothetical protein